LLYLHGKKEHRGRIQSQGGGVEDSESWNDTIPISSCNAIKKTDALEGRHNKREKKLRLEAFNKAKNFITLAALNGGISHSVSKTYMIKSDSHRRVDIEVKKGEAFV